MSKGFFKGFACRMKTIDVFILAEVITFLCFAGGNDVFGAAKTSTPTAKNNGKLVDSSKVGTSNNSAVVAQETKYPLPNEMLQGVVYDLKWTKDLRPTDLIDRNTANMKQPTYYSDVFESITKPFVNESDFFWLKSTESKGNIRYPYFDDYYCLPNRLFNSFFYMENKD